MKNTQAFLREFIRKHKAHKRYMAVLAVLSLIVVIAVPLGLIKNADSQTIKTAPFLPTRLSYESNGTMIDNYTHDRQLSDVTLLIGDKSGDDRYWVVDKSTPEEVCRAIRSQYFLGIASDFCVFLEGNFEPTGADAEGRVAVGGNINCGVANYNIGKGDYAKPNRQLEQITHTNISNFAYGITNGFIKNVGFERNETIFYVKDFNESTSQSFSGNNSRIFYSNKELINFEDEFTFLREQSQKLAKIESKQAVVGGTGDSNFRIVTFDAGEGCNDEVVYFELNADDLGNKIEKCEFRFLNIPYTSTENSVATQNYGNVDDENYKKIPDHFTGTLKPIANIVVNVKGNVTEINTIKTKIANTGNVSDLKQYSNGYGYDGSQYNNHPYSENILYNFEYFNDSDGAGIDLMMKGNANGTILAPNANITDSSAGHLSGALIAKSFKGSLEIGFRPYRGPAAIVGSTVGYAIPVDKFDDYGNHVAGATFTIERIGTDAESYSDTFRSEEGTKYIHLPTQLKLDGSVNYAGVGALTANYKISESTAPEGYFATTDYYIVTVEERIDATNIFEESTNSIPTKGTVTVTIKKNDADTGETMTFSFEDIYGYNDISKKNEHIRREIKMGTNENDPKFALDIENAKVTNVAVVSGEPTSYTTVVSLVVSTEEITTSCNTVVPVTDTNGSVVTETTNIPKRETVQAYDIENIAWGDNDYPDIESITFYYKDANKNDSGSKTFTDVSCNSHEQYWNTITINNIADVDKIGVIGVSVKTRSEAYKRFYIKKGNDFLFGTDEKIYQNFTNGGTIDFFNNDLTPANLDEPISTQVTCTTEITTSWKTITTATATIYVDVPVYNNALISSDMIGTAHTITTPSNFYFDPDSIMLMPMPAQDKNPKFINEKALIFRKVSLVGDVREPLTGASIKLLDENGTAIINSVLSEGESQKAIKLSSLTVGKVYKFVEAEDGVPEGHERADDIYFKIVEETTEVNSETVTTKKLYYSTDENDLGNDNCKSINLKSSELAVIEMDDIKISGAEITLKKVDSIDNTILLKGATFSLYVKGSDVPIAKNITVSDNGTVNLKDALRKDGINSKYIKNGYLMPGKYRLKETGAPTGVVSGNVNNTYDRAEYPFLFTIGEDKSLTAGWESSTEIETQTINKIGLDHIESSDSSFRVTLYDQNGNSRVIPENESNTVGITGDQYKEINLGNVNKENVVGIKIESTNYKGTIFIQIGESNKWEPVLGSDYSTVYDFTKNHVVRFGNCPLESYEIESTVDSLKAKVESGNSNTLLIPNEKQSNNISLTVKKVWNDNGIEDFRAPVTFQIKRTIEGGTPEPVTTDADNQVIDSSKFTLSKENEWTVTFGKIFPRTDSNNNMYTYSVVETSQNKYYTPTYDSKDGVLTITNTLKTANLTIEKKWEGSTSHPSEINVAVYRRKLAESEMKPKNAPKRLAISPFSLAVERMKGDMQLEQTVTSGFVVKDNNKIELDNLSLSNITKITIEFNKSVNCQFNFYVITDNKYNPNQYQNHPNISNASNVDITLNETYYIKDFIIDSISGIDVNELCSAISSISFYSGSSSSGDSGTFSITPSKTSATVGEEVTLTINNAKLNSGSTNLRYTCNNYRHSNEISNNNGSYTFKSNEVGTHNITFWDDNNSGVYDTCTIVVTDNSSSGGGSTEPDPPTGTDVVTGSIGTKTWDNTHEIYTYSVSFTEEVKNSKDNKLYIKLRVNEYVDDVNGCVGFSVNGWTTLTWKLEKKEQSLQEFTVDLTEAVGKMKECQFQIYWNGGKANLEEIYFYIDKPTPTLKLHVGGTLPLPEGVTGEGTGNDTTIATYDANAHTITGVDVGTTQITVGGTLYNIEVVEDEFAITAPKNWICIKEEINLTADGAVSWSVEPTGIVTVDNGKVTGITSGFATITARDADGCEATATIFVKNIVNPTKPADAEFVDVYTIHTNSNNTGSHTISGLDPSYRYYIYEVYDESSKENLLGEYVWSSNTYEVTYPDGYSISLLDESGITSKTYNITNTLEHNLEGYMPSSGGSGSRGYYIIGSLIILSGGAFALCTGKRRRKENE